MTFEITLSPEHVRELTGYSRPMEQLEELHRRGFWRARIDRTGRVVLERAHYEAVCSGHAAPPQRAPRLRPVSA